MPDPIYLSKPGSELRSHYGVVVVGSGYGGAVMASRLARAQFDVCILERGREHQPGDYPRSALEFAQRTQTEIGGRRIGRADALYRYVLERDQGALVGCGLGGTSIINAGVIVRPHRQSWEDHRWPRALREDSERLEEGYSAAETMLRPSHAPPSFPRNEPRLKALQHAARRLGGTFESVPLAINFEGGTSPGGVSQPPCNACGDCITGCNRGSKNTLLSNYLPDAVRHGARVFCSTEVRFIERHDRGWRLHLRLHGVDRERFETTELTIRADAVVLSAGSLGSTEILLRSEARGLTLSSQLGKRFSGNGTVLGFTVGAEDRLHAVGRGEATGKGSPVGPTISGMIDLRGRELAHQRMIIQDTMLPSPLRLLAQAALGLRRGELDRVMAYSVTAGDVSQGRIVLRKDKARIVWPRVGHSAKVRAVNEELSALSSALGGQYRPNPAWRGLRSRPLISTHPLGGCGLGDEASSGVVNHRGQVFSGSEGNAVYENLYVCDGAVLPGSIGTNPLFTISALAERCASYFIGDHTAPAKTVPVVPAPRSTGLRFTERMVGYLSPTVAGPLPVRRPADAQVFSFLLTVEWPSIDALLCDPSSEAKTFGTVLAPSLSAKPLTVVEGSFRLFVRSGDALQMVHRMSLQSETKRFILDAHKVIRDDPGPDLWFDTSTVFVTVRADEDAATAPLARGIAQTRVRDLLRQVTTIKATGAPSRRADLTARAKFLGLFLGTVRDVYGGLLMPLVR